MESIVFKLSQAMGSFGCYAVVHIGFERLSLVQDLALSVAPECAKEYRTAALYGFEYAWEHIPRNVKLQCGVRIVLRQIESVPVDTSSVLVVYAAANALWKALAITPRYPPLIDGTSNGIFFPR